MRRNAIIILLSIELMLNAVNVTFVGFSRHLADMTGQVFAIFVITVAACEAAVGLGDSHCAQPRPHDGQRGRSQPFEVVGES